MSLTSAPPRRDLYELSTELRTSDGPFFVPKSGRRWKYQGTETHYGYTYHLWQNELTERKYAWDVATYRKATTKETV
jgi:hypothetical protein